MAAYYNEIDPQAAAWLRELIKRGLIAAGEVDERSIEDVAPDDLVGFTQCHFFAGIGGWSLALRLAGWPDDLPVWTGSCPCQPFSAAGKGDGFADERHLWPAFHWLIQQRRPAVVFGEQVASKHADTWVDLVCADLEAVGYAFGAVPFPAAGIGAPHIRDRNYWVADADCLAGGQRGAIDGGWHSGGDAESRPGLCGGGVLGDGGMAHSDGWHASAEREQCGGEQRFEPEDGCGLVGMADTGSERRTGEPVRLRQEERGWDAVDIPEAGRLGGLVLASGHGADQGDDRPLHATAPAGPTNGHWRAADWLACRDGKWRPVEASPQPLVDGLPESLGRVRDSCIAEVEAEITAYAKTRETSCAQALRNLCEGLDAQAQRGWAPGGLPDLQAPSFLLAFVCQLATQGWTVAQGLPLRRPEAAGAGVRMLWDHEEATRASRQRGLEGQPARERADAVHLLSPVLARHAQEAWGLAYRAHAEIGFPLGRDIPARVGRLRGYGNAIVPQAAAEFVRAFM